MTPFRQTPRPDMTFPSIFPILSVIEPKDPMKDYYSIIPPLFKRDSGKNTE